MSLSLKRTIGEIPPGRFRFSEPDPGRTFNTLKDCVAFVAEYRAANGIDPGEPDKEIQDFVCQQIPEASRWVFCNESGHALPMPVRDPKEHDMTNTGYQGQAKWMELHRWSLYGSEDPVARAAWLLAFAISLPCGDCRRNWKKLRELHWPPLTGSPEELFRWTWELHNKVNKALGHKELEHEEALALYR